MYIWLIYLCCAAKFCCSDRLFRVAAIGCLQYAGSIKKTEKFVYLNIFSLFCNVEKCSPRMLRDVILN